MTNRLVALGLALALTALGGLGAFAQSTIPKLLPRCGGPYNLCGFIDRDSKAMVIPQRFELAFPFSEGLAAVRIKGRYGYIDEAGKEVIAPKFDLAGGFFQGLAEVLVGQQTGIIDKAGSIIVKPQFARAYVLTKDVLIAREGDGRSPYYQGALDSLLQALLLGYPSRSWGLYHIRTGWITTRDLTFRRFEIEGRGLVWATRGNEYHGPFGLMRADGSWQVEPRFSHVQELSEDRAIVGIPDTEAPAGTRNREKRGAVDRDGNVILTPAANRNVSYYHNGFGLVNENGKQGLVDPAGNLVGGRLFDEVQRPETGDVAKVKLDGKWVGLTRDGRVVAAPDNGKVIASCPSGVKLVMMDGMVEVRGADDKPTAPQRFDFSYNKLNCDRPSVVVVGPPVLKPNIVINPNARRGFIGTDGRLLRDPVDFENVNEFKDGYATAKIAGKWGIIDRTGQFVLEPRYTTVQLAPIGGGLFAIQDGKTRSLINVRGEPQAEPPPPKSQREAHLKCQGGLEIFHKPDLQGGGTFGIRDSAGKVVVEAQHRAVQCFENGVAWVADDARKQWCPVGPDGAWQSNLPCLQVRYTQMRSHHYPEQLSSDPYESSVLWTRALYDYALGKRASGPRFVGDGVQGSGSFEVQ